MAIVTKKNPVIETVVVDPGGVTLELSLDEAAYVTGVLGTGNDGLSPDENLGQGIYGKLVDVLEDRFSYKDSVAMQRANAYGAAHRDYVKDMARHASLVRRLKKELKQIGEIQ